MLASVSLAVATLGPGSWSVDDALGIAGDMDGMTGFWIALVIGVGGGIAQMLTFYRPSSVSSGGCSLASARGADGLPVADRPPLAMVFACDLRIVNNPALVAAWRGNVPPVTLHVLDDCLLNMPRSPTNLKAPRLQIRLFPGLFEMRWRHRRSLDNSRC